MPFERSKDIPYVRRPNLINARARGLAIINTDALGLCSKTAGATYGAKEQKEYRITIVGDSVTMSVLLKIDTSGIGKLLAICRSSILPITQACDPISVTSEVTGNLPARA